MWPSREIGNLPESAPIMTSNSSTFRAAFHLVGCFLLAGQPAFSDEHDKAPPTPTERRTHLDAKGLAEALAAGRRDEKPVDSKLPPLPDGVQELAFREFYRMPVGPRGLEPSGKLLSLNGKRVRIRGFMGEVEPEDKRRFILTPIPLKPQPEEYGACDDIPATHVLVTVPGNPDEPVRHLPGPLLLTGTLSVGSSPREGGTSFVRLLLDPPAERPVPGP